MSFNQASKVYSHTHITYISIVGVLAINVNRPTKTKQMHVYARSDPENIYIGSTNCQCHQSFFMAVTMERIHVTCSPKRIRLIHRSTIELCHCESAKCQGCGRTTHHSSPPVEIIKQDRIVQTPLQSEPF